MEYLGYVGCVVFDDEAGIFHGRVINTKDIITFEGESVTEIRQAFRDSVDDYLEFCAELGSEPEKPMSGKFNVRITPRLHAYAVAAARSRQISLNTLVERAIEQFVDAPAPERGDAPHSPVLTARAKPALRGDVRYGSVKPGPKLIPR